MALKVAKAPAYNEVNDIPEVRTEDVPAKRALYKRLLNKETTLSDDDIVNLVAYAEDDQDENDWVLGMVAMEEGQLPPFATDEGDKEDERKAG